MQQPARFERIDYLAIGHITIDQTPHGPRLGGSAAYAALTAQALGWRAGIVTAWAQELPLGPLAGLPIVNLGAEKSSTFENIYTPSGRLQRYSGEAPFLEFHLIPEAWRDPRILHLAPVAREVSPRILKYFEDSFLGVTPQGWLRDWDADGQVRVTHWEEGGLVLNRADAAVLSRTDVSGDQLHIERLAAACPLLVVTDGETGATVYAQGEVHHLSAPAAHAVDPTGAGDIFAAAFFVQLYQGAEPRQAARFASVLAARSVERPGLEGVPSREEIYDLTPEAS
ncbi:MAG TPA: PfkB family carbohydrate kinase [Anaerolineales bacterium]|nr:PfkB family carbohydrate kinase [Anaerolineales bacterium]